MSVPKCITKPDRFSNKRDRNLRNWVLINMPCAARRVMRLIAERDVIVLPLENYKLKKKDINRRLFKEVYILKSMTSSLNQLEM